MIDEIRKLNAIENLLTSLSVAIQQQNKVPLDIITQKNLLKELNISPGTLKSWENKGLKRLEPPIDGTRTVFYKLEDIISFLTP
ncbi:MerR family transcriptional regulator [Streptococcus suis]|uniref:MerR family transcriptional regulator n=1 Tax=Streptococcus suis TaxID=1307 RepID=UPI000CF650F8|nr:MerR family transcriptional regulator [Streptococcus suis]MBO3756079.1 MerR family transcriptional regulator [Streptococcus suis]